MEKNTVTRDQLYNEAWSTPLSRLAPKYHISDVALKKICKKLNIPTPPRGYWAKSKNGKKAKRIPLPNPKKDQEMSWNFRLQSNKSRQKDYRESLKKKQVPVDLGFKIKVPQRLHSPHYLIQKTKQKLLKADQDYSARVLCSYSKDCLDVYIGPNSINRAMRILNALLRTFHKLGYRVETEKGRFPRSFVLIDGQKIQFCMREKGYRRKHVSTEEDKEYPWRNKSWDHFTNGELTLEIKGRGNWFIDKTKWSDRKQLSLEEQLNDFVEWTIRAAQALKEDKKRQEAERIKELENQRKRKEIEHLRNIELERRSQLEAQAKSFTKSQYIYNFLDEIERQKDKAKLTDTQSQHFDKWISWARRHADRLNPVKQALDSIIRESK